MRLKDWSALFGLQDKLAVISDFGGNAGPDVARMLGAAGAQVVFVDVDVELVESVAKSISGDGVDIMGLVCDVTDEEQVVCVFDEIVSRNRTPDILINCGAVNANGDLSEFTSSLWDDVQSVNLRSVFLTMRECLRHMKSSGRGGRIVNVTTMGSKHPVLKGNGAYCAARAGVGGLVRSAALDYAEYGICVNEVLPGAIPSKVQFHEQTLRALQSGYELRGPCSNPDERVPLGFGCEEDIAAAVLYLVGPSGGYITGQSIVLDGGFLIS